jgi:hypothetical protein
MRPRPVQLVLAAFIAASVAPLLAGCLQEGRPVVGRSLVPGRAVERPIFVKDGDWVSYELRRRPAEPPYSGSFDFQIVNYDTGEVRPLVENVADRWGKYDGGAGVYYLITDEAALPNLSTMGTLVQLSLDEGVLDRIPNVTSYAVLPGTREFFYRQMSDENARLSTLHYRSARGDDRILGMSSGAVEFHGNRVYFVAGEESGGTMTKVLSRILRPDGPIEVVRGKVNRFVINDDQSWAILQTADSGKSQIVARQLDTGVEHVVPASPNAYWFPGFGARLFTFSEPASPGTPATLHTYDVVTEVHSVTPGPAGLVDIRDVRQRPNSTDRLFTDSHGQLAVVKKGEVDGQLIGGNPNQLSITDDGKYALWIELVITMPPQGKLMVQDLDFKDPPRMLSPKGGMVPVPGYFFISDRGRPILVFWAQFGRNGVDLYYADHETGDNRVVAESISEVVVTPFQVIGIVRVSEQDLIGDLVNKDLALNTEIPLAHEVADDAIFKDRVVFVIRERVTSDRDGLWAIGIDGTPPDAAVAGSK